jgi:regulator of cell morphogenesis and NO signaling
MLDYHPVNFNRMDPAELCEYIAKRHHGYIRESLGKIADHLKTALKLDVKAAPELHQIVYLFDKLTEDLEQHFRKEEKMLFPFIQNFVAVKKTGKRKKGLPLDLVDHPLQEMNEEHKKLGYLLSEIRQLSHNYFLTPQSSPTQKLCFYELFDLEEDLHKKFFLEENILTPKLITLEQEMEESNGAL